MSWSAVRKSEWQGLELELHDQRQVPPGLDLHSQHRVRIISTFAQPEADAALLLYGFRRPRAIAEEAIMRRHIDQIRRSEH